MLINCAAYQDGRKLGDIAVNEIARYLSQPGCFVWVALKEPEPAELQAMQAEFGLHELAVEDAQHGHQRPKIDEYGDSLFVVLKTIEPGADGLSVGELAVFAGPNYVLSVRRNTQGGFADVRTRSEHEPELLRHGSVYVLYALMDAVVDRYFPVLDALETEFEEIERRIFTSHSTRGNIEALYLHKQKLATVKHAVAPLLEATSRLFGGRVPHLCSGLQDYFRDVYDHVLRVNQSIDSLREGAAIALSVNLALITLQESETVKRLAAYGALIAVPTLIAGIYGMNFDLMPELRSRFGYPIAIAIMAAIDGYLFWRFRRARWL